MSFKSWLSHVGRCVLARASAGCLVTLFAIAIFGLPGTRAYAQNLAVNGQAYVVRFTPGVAANLDGAPVALRQPITLHLNHVTIERALREVTGRAGISLSYSRSVVPLSRRVSVDVQDGSVVDALSQVLNGTGVELWVSKAGRMVLVPSANPETRAASSATADAIVTGKVTSVSGAPVAGATVSIASLNVSAVTDAAGVYKLTVPSTNVAARQEVLSVTRIGFRPARIPFALHEGPITVDIQLSEVAISLDQVVVTGTAGNQERRAQSAVVATIDVADVTNKAPVSDVTQVLEARVPSVQVLPGSGVTGAAPRINIRGAASINLSNEPLVFVDGIRVTSNPRYLVNVGGQSVSALNDINPDDIESIEVVKGPAAATLYGADASAGVIQIITKKGHLGTKHLAQTITTEYNKIEPNFTPPSVYGACPNSPAFIGPNSPYVLCRGQAAGTIVSDNPNVRNDAFRDGKMGSLGYSARGGGESYGFYLSGEAQNEMGTTINNSLVRRTGRASLNWVASSRLNFDGNFGLSRNDYKLPFGDTGNYGYLINAALTSPITLQADANGNLLPGYAGTLSVPAISSILNEVNTVRSTPSVQANYNPFPWLTNRLTVGADLSNTEATQFFPRNDNSYYGAGLDAGSIDVLRQTADVYTVDYQGNIKTSFFGHDNIASNFSFGSQYISTSIEGVGASGQGLLTNSSNLVSSTPAPVGSQSYNQQKSLGYYAQEQLGFSNKLFLQVAARVDRNSAFGNESKSFFLPKAGASYVISEEPFWNRLKPVISTLRLRAAYGTTGRAPTPGASLTTYSSFAYVSEAGTLVSGVAPRNPGNQNLKPERGKEFETGFEAGFFNDRAGLDVTYFDKRTDDLLLVRPLPPSLGFSQNPYANLGGVDNHGFEFTVRATPISRENLTWDATFMGSTLHNELLSLGDLQPIISSAIAAERRFVVGRPLGSWYGTKVVGFNATKDTALVSDTAVYLGQQAPTFQGSFNTTITLFKKLRIYAMFQGQRGASLFNVGQFYRDQFLGNSAEVVLPPDQGGYSAQERLLHNGPFRTVSGSPVGASQVVGSYIQSTNYVRFQELSATLTLPSSFAQSLHVAGASVTVGGRNLHLWTSYQGADPEVSSIVDGTSNTQFVTYDAFTQPPTRRWIARLNLQF